MSELYFCENENRRRAVENSITLNGIDYLEIGAAQTTLQLHFLHALPGVGAVNPIPAAPELTVDNFVIAGGVRVRGVRIVSLTRIAKTLTLQVNAPGDFSTYTLRLVKSPLDHTTPQGYDPQLAAINFSFRVDCPSDFDCAPDDSCPPEKFVEPEINYLAKDYNSFRRLMLDRLSVVMPEWRERNPADMQVALVELLAYVGDHLSYYQDAVATEAYLGTARQRVSVRRHARLLDYVMQDGCNARTWAAFTYTSQNAADVLTLAAGKNPLLTRGATEQVVIAPDEFRNALVEQPTVFETMLDVTLNESHNEIHFYTWSDANCCLPRGSTRATLLNQPQPQKPNLNLKPNDFLLFEEIVSPTTGLNADADLTHRHVVRLTRVQPDNDPLDNTPILHIDWNEEDALPFPLCLSAVITNAQGQPTPLPFVSVARGNVTLADHGLSFPFTISPTEKIAPPFALQKNIVPARGKFRPTLDTGALTLCAPLRDNANSQTNLKPSATALLQFNAAQARPSVSLLSDSTTWVPARQSDLLSSNEFAAEFVAEQESDGHVYFRFGDDTHGRAPSVGQEFFVQSERLGNGSAGNLGAEALARIVIDTVGAGITRVRNPIAASGGADIESAEHARLYAPQAFRRQERAVTAADYAEVTQRFPGVQKAAATLRWTGSWYTMFITVDRAGGRAVTAEFENALRAFLEKFRMAGMDLEINGPSYVPLDLKIQVCVKPDYFASNVKRALLEKLSHRDLPDGTRGFFHPDNFTFGDAVFTSQLYAVVMAVPGVASALIETFQRWGKTANEELKNGVLTASRLEVIRLDNDPNFPENGRIELDVQGGI